MPQVPGTLRCDKGAEVGDEHSYAVACNFLILAAYLRLRISGQL